MTSYPNMGLKGPLNVIENPIQPIIKKGPPRFVWSRKYWKVDVGTTLKDTSNNVQTYENAIRIQPRDYNQTRYGVSSHRDYVNLEFRPPLRAQQDNVPLSRLPREVTVPRINPGSDDGGFKQFNPMPSDVGGFLTERVKNETWQPTYYMPMDRPVDNSILPDLQLKMPSVSASAGFEMPYKGSEIAPDINYDFVPDIDRLYPRFHSGYEMPVKVDGEVARPDFFPDNRPMVEGFAWINTPMQTTLSEQDQGTRLLLDNRPSVAATAGVNTPMQSSLVEDVGTPVLAFNRPSVSASSGVTMPFDVTPLEDHTPVLSNKSSTAPIFTHPGVEMDDPSRYRREGDALSCIRGDAKRDRYTLPVQASRVYRPNDTNALTHQPHVRSKITVAGSATAGGAVPRRGLDVPTIQLREKGGR